MRQPQMARVGLWISQNPASLDSWIEGSASAVFEGCPIKTFGRDLPFRLGETALPVILEGAIAPFAKSLVLRQGHC